VKQAAPARSPGGAWRAAVSTFTIIPARGPATIDPGLARRIALLLPAVGCLLALPAAGILLAVEAAGPSSSRKLLAAVLAIATLAVLTGGLHLDGLADTADGIGSRCPGPQALEIMRRSDVGPMGVATLVLTLLIQITAVAAISPRWLGAAALVTATVTSRAGAVLATGAPAARAHGFGALIAQTTSRTARWLTAALLLVAVIGAAAAARGPMLAVRGASAVVCGLAVAAAMRWLACRRLGGMTGDVYGALIEISTATVLLVAAMIG